ncbi:MAG: hypothetical protein JRJ41_06445 [Deltaproteobacteria bacterium]|nr:hypothetical protein [Deltaproteobacteria bacterium]
MKTIRCIILFFIIFIFLTLPITSLASIDLPAQYCLVQNNWKKLFSKNGITVYSKKAPDSDVLALKASGILKAPMDQVMEVLRKVEISKEWIPHIDTKNTVKDFSDLEAITHSVNILPWPLADRSLLLHNKLRLDREKKYLVIDIHSVDFDTNPIKKDRVRANMYCGQTFMRPVGEEKTEIELILFVDPRGHIPAWLVNMAQKSMPYNFLRALEEKASRTNYELRPSFKKMLDQLLVLLKY